MGVVVLALLFCGLILAIYPGWMTIGEFFQENIDITVRVDASILISIIGLFSAFFVSKYVAYIPIRNKNRELAISARVIFYKCIFLIGALREGKDKNNYESLTLHTEQLISYVSALDKLSYESFPEKQMKAFVEGKAVIMQMITLIKMVNNNLNANSISYLDKWLSVMIYEFRCNVDVLHEEFLGVPAEKIDYEELSDKICKLFDYSNKAVDFINSQKNK